MSITIEPGEQRTAERPAHRAANRPAIADNATRRPGNDRLFGEATGQPIACLIVKL